MDFFYPNMQNDMWRIFGLIFFNERDRFIVKEEKRFDRESIKTFLTETGIALYDTAFRVRRLQENASDKFLEVVEPTDFDALLRLIPACRAVVTTGQKATDTFRARFAVPEPSVGGSAAFCFEGREMKLYRMPSSSRAYPLALEKKAAAYRMMLAEVFPEKLPIHRKIKS